MIPTRETAPHQELAYTLIEDSLYKPEEPRYTVEDIEKMYPSRNLPEGTEVTRVAPSPTGFAHLGFLYMSLACERIAHRSEQGVFILRIEDTDQKREKEGAQEILIQALNNFDVKPDEGPEITGETNGEYGPYVQTERAGIYKAYALKLLKEGKAYPCFCSEEELRQMREVQEQSKVATGYYGAWAKWKNAPLEAVEEQLQKGTPFVLRFNADKAETPIVVEDAVAGKITFNDTLEDFVLLKSNGIPTYHLAHLIDDHLMQVTTVIRGNEWTSSLPKHVSLNKALGFKMPRYAHLAPIEKLDNGGRRKLSKRKDPEANIDYFYNYAVVENPDNPDSPKYTGGYEPEVVKAYLMSLLLSNYEDESRKRGKTFIEDFEVDLLKLKAGSGALLDMTKLNDISSNFLAGLTADEMYARLHNWTVRCSPNIQHLIEENHKYTTDILNIGKDSPTPRKDIRMWTDFMELNGYFYDEIYEQLSPDWQGVEHLSQDVIVKVCEQVANLTELPKNKEEWVAKFKEISTQLGFTDNKAELKANPHLYVGAWKDFMAVVRIALAGKNKSPDLYNVMEVMGIDRVKNRLQSAAVKVVKN